MKNIRALFLTCLAISLVSACRAPADDTRAPDDAAQAMNNEKICMQRNYSEEIGGPIDLIDQDGNPVTEADFKGAPTLVYFGFTYCPDVCPTALVRLNHALERLPEDMARPQSVLITIDPKRDTPEAMKAYVETEAFPDGLVGLTGSDAQIKSAADAFIAYYSRVDLPDSAASYTMDHSSIIYLMDEEWELKSFFTETDGPDQIAACLQDLL